MFYLLLPSLIFSGCISPAPVENVSRERVSVSRKRIQYAVEMCKANGKVKEIQIKTQEIIICGNGAVFRR